MLRVGLCAQLSETSNITANMARMEDMAGAARRQGLDAIFLGEAYLQGFDSLRFQPEHDREIALGISSQPIEGIRKMARNHRLAVGFGFYELAHEIFYASYLVLDRFGDTLCHYRRLSSGWRYPDSPACYQEGKTLTHFEIRGIKIGLMVCGDFWTEALMGSIHALERMADAMLWPVHCDYPLADWENGIRDEYRERSGILTKPVMFVNNLHPAPERAKGGAYCWHKGETQGALSAGQAGMLAVSLPLMALRPGAYTR